MSDRTGFRVYVYACPQDQQQAVLGVLADQLALDLEDEQELMLADPYECDQVTESTAIDLRDALIEAAPGASFLAWEDAFTTGPGELCAYTPQLGPFGPSPCTGSDVLMTLDDIRAVLDTTGPAASRSAILAALGQAMGTPWREDWQRHTAPGTSAPPQATA